MSKGKIWFFIVALVFSFLVLSIIWGFGGMKGILNMSNQDDIANVAVEFHGMVFDVLLFGIVLTIYELYLERKREKEIKELEKKLRIDRLNEEIEDYRGWDEKEAMHRITGNVKRLNKEGVSTLNLSKCYLMGADLEGINLEKANLFGANLSKANLKVANLTNAILEDTVFGEANMSGANLTKSYMEDASFTNADLSNANLSEGNLQQAYFINSNLKNTDFTNAFMWRAVLRGAFLFDTKLLNTHLESVKLDGAKVNSLDWFEKLEAWNVVGIEYIRNRYFIDETPIQIGDFGEIHYEIKDKAVLKLMEGGFPNQCIGITIQGTRCKRVAKENSTKCHQHLSQRIIRNYVLRDVVKRFHEIK